MGELPTTSQGVDLFELERLRVLVRFEFDRELTQDELIVALTRCHNNTREAYHFLKEQRRQEQLNAAAEMVAAATAMAHGGSASAQVAVHGHGANGLSSNPNSGNGNGAKRRSDSDGDGDGDVSMDTPNKRHRVSTDAVTIDLSQPTEVLDMTQATQEQDDSDNLSLTPTHKRPRHYSLERASQIISDVVGTIVQSAHASRDDAQWLLAALEALAVKRVSHLDDPLVVVVEALANALKHVPTMDVGAVQSDGIKQIMDVLVQLPRQDQYDVELRLEPSNAKMDEDVHKVDNSFACAIADHMNKSARAQAAKNAISVIKDALASCIVRQESISKSVQSAQAHRRRVRTRVRDLKNSIQARLEQAGKDVRTSEQEMVQARNNQMTHTTALMAVVVEHKAALIAQGEEEADATLNAHAAVVHSTDAGVVRLRQVREESQLLHKARKQDVMRANTRLEFYQKLEVLRQKVAPCVQDWLEASTRQVELLKADAERFVEEKMAMYVSQMIQSLRLYYEFHTLRQMLANKDKEKQKESLNEHMEFYDDLVPSSKKEIENKIREFTGVIMHSTQCMREIASLQCELWEGKRKLFPPHVFAIVDSEYGKLYNQLSGGAKDMMLDVVKVIRDQPAAAQLVASPRAYSPPIVGHSATVTPYEFVGRDFDSHRPQPVRGFQAPAVSPMVDLTGDGDGDVSMDGINMDGFVRERFVVYQPNNQASNEPMSEDGLGPTVEQPAFKTEKNTSEAAAPAPTKTRDFPMGSHLCWMLKDEDGDTNVHFGYVKGLVPSGSYILEDSEGLEHTIPAASLFTQEEREAYVRAQGQNTENEDGAKEKCAIM